VEVSLDKLREVNSQGDEEQHSDNLAGSHFGLFAFLLNVTNHLVTPLLVMEYIVWGTPSWELVNGVNTTRVPLNATVRVDKSYVPFGMIVWLYQADGTVTWHGQSYEVKKNHAKFTISIGMSLGSHEVMS
jgi:uncharacterized protein involved in tellurium resistance